MKLSSLQGIGIENDIKDGPDYMVSWWPLRAEDGDSVICTISGINGCFSGAAQARCSIGQNALCVSSPSCQLFAHLLLQLNYEGIDHGCHQALWKQRRYLLFSRTELLDKLLKFVE